MVQNKFPRINAQKSKSGETLILDDGGENRIVVSVNLLKHVLEVPYTRRDGTAVTEETFAEERARKAAFRGNRMRGSEYPSAKFAKS